MVMKAIVATIAAAGALFAGAACAAGPLDGFLAGFDRACAVQDGFKALSQSLNARYNEGGNPAAPLVVPADITPLIGPITSAKKDGFVEVKVALSGTYHDLKVSGLQFAFGIENGIYAYAIVFDEPEAKVHAAFDATIKAGNAKLAREVEAGASTGINSDNGKTQLYCDWSN